MNQKFFSLLFAGMLGVFFCAALLIYGEPIRTGVIEGLRACADVVIPSLYLFMAVSGFISRSGAGGFLSKPLGFVVRKLFKLPECMASVILLSFIGGYPVGAKAMEPLLECGAISKKQAERALCFCCNAGPSFVITAIGSRLLGSIYNGLILLAAHILAAIFIGITISYRESTPERFVNPVPRLPLSRAFIAGLNDATSGIISICSFVVFFSALGTLFLESGAAERLSAAVSFIIPGVSRDVVCSLFIGVLEVTAGIIRASALPGSLPFFFIPLMVSFAGLSIHFQVRAMLDDYHLRYMRFFFCRILHAVLTLLFCRPFFRPVPATQTFGSFGFASGYIGYRTPNTPFAVILLLLVGAAVLKKITDHQRL